MMSESEFDIDSETEDWHRLLTQLQSSKDLKSSTVAQKSELMPLYDRVRISVIDSYILILHYALKHSLTKKAFEELIKVISVHLPTVGNVPKSVYQFKNFSSKSFQKL